ncbi:hypothetical protein N7492_008289, partial [Penicillium capsulatum]
PKVKQSNSRMALPIRFLRGPAESALKTLLKVRIDAPPCWKGISREILSGDAVLVLSACEALQNSETIIDDGIICASAKILVESLSATALLKLSLMTWNFDSSGVPSEELTRFLRQPNNQHDWESIHGQYQRSTGRESSLSDFKASCDLLLWPTLGSVFNGVS